MVNVALFAKRETNAKQDTRGGEKNKLSVTSPLLWLFQRSLYEYHTPIGQLMTHCSGEILVYLSGTKSLSRSIFCFEESSSFSSNNKGKTKEMLKFIT